MLYATTRNLNDIQTAHKAIHQECASDGGLFVPFRMPKFSEKEILSFSERTYGQNVALILNHFFGCNLSGWDVEFAIGRTPMKLAAVQHRVIVAETWHNTQWKFDYVLQILSDRIRREEVGAKPTDWMKIAVRIATFFAVYGEMIRSGELEPGAVVDVAVTVGDFSVPIAAWYSREMGLPIGNIVCGCNANGGVWDLLHHGEMPTGDIAVHTCTPEADFAIPKDLERLIYGTLGTEETMRYLSCCRSGTIYSLTEDNLETLRSGILSAVISDSRVGTIIPSVYHTSKYIFGPYSALAYGSLMDYRAKTGESRTAMLLSERSPVCDREFVAKVMNTIIPDLSAKMNMI